MLHFAFKVVFGCIWLYSALKWCDDGSVCVFDSSCGHKNPIWAQHRSPPLSWEQNRPKWTQYAAHSSLRIFRRFLDPFDIFSFDKPPPPLPPPPPTHSPSIIPAFMGPTGHPPPTPQRSGLAGGPSWGSLPSIGADWALAVESAQINPSDSNIWFPLSPMTMLVFGMQPGEPDQICGIDLGGRAARGPENTDTSGSQYKLNKRY